MADSILWFRRDLRLSDHPALVAAAADGAVLPLFVLDDTLLRTAGDTRRNRLLASVRALHEATDGALVIRRGKAEEVVPAVAQELGTSAVHITGEPFPYGRRRDDAVRKALQSTDIELLTTGTPYAVGPGRIVKGDGTPFKVFTPFSRAWRDRGWHSPAGRPTGLRWVRRIDGDALPDTAPDERAGEQAALDRWNDFRESDLGEYDDQRDRPDRDRTSRLSEHLKYGEIHPRTLLDAMKGTRGDGVERFTTELCWREFYADVLWNRPDSAWGDLNDLPMKYDDPDEKFEAWQQGRTGFPMVDAGMRQLLAEGWMHNRVRMITASFLVKHLHVWWPHGARHFLDHLRDGDLASNNHGWQWVAGTGTDASPYFRIFNPLTQGLKFDPQGDYVRRYVPELRHLSGRAAHEPWTQDDGYAQGYPERLLDLGAEREESLARYAAARR
ncbi:deoxyribodipyrimidine photo-lyase [Nakamurella sp. A5-74]|uniref:Deoxyribodipyrimidine photo-lyase n=1 Tax=Nakamurella sp. A5-74 TaxID=3158264 RepID=A0AAU8DPD0_9ACTN